MKKILSLGIGLMLVLSLGFQAAALEAQNAITVTGTGVIKVKPDIAVLYIGVMTEGATPAIQTQNTATMNKVLAAVKEQGVADKDIQTTAYQLQPLYNYGENNKDPKVTGYRIDNIIEVKVRDMTKSGTVLEKAVAAGANINQGIQFRLSDMDTPYLEALSKAVANGKAKASALAKSLGVTIGLPTSMVETQGYAPYQQFRNYNTGAANMADQASVQAGELEITASVTMVYSFK